MEIYIATKNRGKIAEFETFFTKYGYTVKSLLDVDDTIEIDETGMTFKENALLKARFLSQLLKKPALADDSGLEVPFLNNEPGVYSARYAGIHGNDEANNEKLLKKLEGVPDDKRNAKFLCALALVYPDGTEIVTEGACEGRIIHERRGEYGFGYDPLFLVEEYNKTFAQLTKEEKEKISHRGKALKKLAEVLND